MLIVTSPTALQEIQQNHSHFFETMVKVVVDIQRKMIALDADLHADLEQSLLEEGSIEVEFTSLINIRPAQNNKSMEIKDPKVQKKVTEIVKKLLIK